MVSGRSISLGVPQIKLIHKWHLQISERSGQLKNRLLQLSFFFVTKLSQQDRIFIFSRKFWHALQNQKFWGKNFWIFRAQSKEKKCFGAMFTKDLCFSFLMWSQRPFSELHLANTWRQASKQGETRVSWSDLKTQSELECGLFVEVLGK